jgi:hypothetical protein
MRGLVALFSIVVIVSTTAVALAANPKKRGLYSGTNASSSVTKRITLKVSKNGKSAIANLYCASQHVSVMKGVKIAKGHFSGKKTNGSLLVWKIKGSFSSRTTAHATATLKAICDGGRVPVTLTLAG